MKKNSSLFETLTDEISHHPIVGLLAIFVVLMHLWVVVKLLQPTDADKVPEQIKIMEVALVTEVKPKVESAPPAPAKPNPPKKEPPKKKAVKPPVKKKEPIVHKQGDIPKPKLVTNEQKPTLPLPTMPAPTKETPSTSAPSNASITANKPVTKPGNGKTQGANSGIVELGCPKPKYPARAMSRHLEGWVKIEVTISTAGTVSNAIVASAQPPGVFDDAALEATKKCKFKPKLVNGLAVTQKGIKKSTFKLSN
ncbi:TonB family protein [Methyloglobulus sp.]|uniref:energy transducer TonB n=1 Tax=Methyloglobulus sp. TaxID=2518622 RepID=UPI0032B7B2F0